MNEPVCEVCGESRSAHEFLNHLFSQDGQLTPKKKSNPVNKAGVTLGRLIGILSTKGILTPEEVGRLLSEE